MFYILKSTYLYRSQGFFFNQYFFLEKAFNNLKSNRWKTTNQTSIFRIFFSLYNLQILLDLEFIII